jgi:hypothetical protein
MKKFLVCLILIQAASGGGASAMDVSKFDCRAELREIAVILGSARITPDGVRRYLTLRLRAEAEDDLGDLESSFATVNEIRKMFDLPTIE